MILKSSKGDKVFVSWSGGKDSYLALLKAKEAGLQIVSLLSFISADGESRSHGIKTGVLEKQSELLGIPLHTEIVTWESYEDGFTRAVEYLKKDQLVTGGVFGDINLAEHRQWVEKMCRSCDINYNLPLWMMKEENVSKELINRKIKAMLVALRHDLLSEQWLGRYMDEEYIQHCLDLKISPCGEGGEAHTLVTDGPLFSKPLQYKKGEILRDEKRALLQVFV